MSSRPLLPATILLAVGCLCCRSEAPPAGLGDGAIELPTSCQALEIEVTGGERRILGADLDASDYLRIVVEAASANLDIGLITPSLERLELGRARRDGPTPVSLVSERAGAHGIAIACDEPENVSIQLTIRVTDRRSSTAGDGDRVRAERLFFEAEALRLEYEVRASEKAIEAYRSGIAAWKLAGDLGGAALACQRIGSIFEQTGDLDSALRAYREGLDLSREITDQALEIRLMSAVGGVRSLLGDYDAALKECREANSLAERTASPRGRAMALNCLGEVAYLRGNLQQAVGFYRQAEALWRSLGDRAGRAQSFLYLGYTYSDLSEVDRAASFYDYALSLWRLLPDRRGEALTLVALGRLHRRLGEYQAALNAFNEAMTLLESMGDSVWQASVHAGMGSVYHDMGENPRALAYWKRALELFREAGLQTVEVELLLSIGEIHLASEDHRTAISHFEQALVLTRELENQRWEALSLRLIGLTYQMMKRHTEAIEYFNQSLDLQQSGENRRVEAYTRGELGQAFQSLGRHDLAIECFGRALELSRASSDRVGEAIGLFNLAGIASRQHRPAEARHYIEETLRIAESLRSGVESRELRASYLASIQLYHRFHIETLMRLHGSRPSDGLDALAFEASERARARSLLESLTEAGVDVRQGVDPELLARERQLKRTLDGKAERQIRLGSSEASQMEAAALAREIQNLTTRYDQLQAEIRSKSPHYAALTQPEPLSLESVQEQVLDEQTLVLEYSLGEERSFLWAVERGRHTSIELPPRAEIERASREVYRMLTARLPTPDETVKEYRTRVKEADAGYWQAAARLSDMLLGPVADRLSGKRIVVVSDGALQYLPFAALPEPDRGTEVVPMIVEHEIVNLPSISALAVLRSESLGREVSGLSVAVLADPVFELDDPRLRGDTAVTRKPGSRSSPAHRVLRDVGFVSGSGLGIPRLISTRWEADAILAAAPPGTTLRALDFDASRSTALSPELGRYRIVHFATHGIVNNEHPGLSGIILSMVDESGHPTNGFVRLHDIYNMDLPAELVVLSACNSALGKPVDGEGLVGIVRGFMYAGARRVVASLWKVDDEATGELMSRFYREMLREHRSPAAALRHAQIAMWQQGEWKAPFYWAAFVLQGEWK